VLGLGVVAYFTPLKAWLGQGEAIKSQLDGFGIAAPGIFTAGTALLTALGTPRLLLCSLGGVVFGFAWGLAWALAGTLLGSYALFLAVRWKGRDYTLNRCPRLRGLAHNLQRRGVLSVALVRQIPLNCFYNTVLLGLAPVSHRDFLLGSLLGFLPLALTACLLGAGLIQGDWLQGVQYLSLGLACSVILGPALGCWVRRNANGGTGPV